MVYLANITCINLYIQNNLWKWPMSYDCPCGLCVVLSKSFLYSSKCILWSSYSIIDRTMRVKVKNNSNTVDLWVIRILLFFFVFRTKFIKNPVSILKKKKKSKFAWISYSILAAQSHSATASLRWAFIIPSASTFTYKNFPKTVSRCGSFSQLTRSAKLSRPDSVQMREF